MIRNAPEHHRSPKSRDWKRAPWPEDKTWSTVRALVTIEGVDVLRRIAFFAACASLVAVSFVGSAAASAPPAMKVQVCVTTSGDLLVTTTWRNEAPDGTQGTLKFDYRFTAADPSFNQATTRFIFDTATPSGSYGLELPPFQTAAGPTAWDEYTSVSVLTSGPSFHPDSDVVNRPKPGWRTCK